MEITVELLLLSRHAHLQITTFTVGGVDQRSNFKFLECETKHPVFGNATNALEAIPACQWPKAIQVSDRRRCDVHVDVHRLIAVIIGLNFFIRH